MSAKLNFRTIWTVSLVLYIICSTAFSYGDLKILNSISLYLFLAISVFNILVSGRIKLNIAIASMAAYALIALVGSLYTPTANKYVDSVIYNLITMTILAICIVQYIDTTRDLNTVIQSYMLAGLALAIYVYSLYGDTFWDLMREMGAHDDATVDRLGTELTNVNTISVCTTVSAIIAVYNVFTNRHSKTKMLLNIGIAVFCFLVSMASASKKSILLIVVCMISVWIYVSIGNSNMMKTIRNCAIAAGAVIVLLYMIDTMPIFAGIAKRFESMFEFLSGGAGTSSEVNRTNMINKGISVWLDHPFFGAGTAASIHYIGVYSHNNFVEVLMNSGLGGFVAFYSAYMYAIKKYVKQAIYYRKTAKVTILLFALLIGVTICGIAQVYYYNRYYMYLLVTIFSVPAVLGEGEEKAESI